MMCSGCFMLLNPIRVTSGFGMGQWLYGFSAMGGNYGVTTGMIMTPFIFGIGFIFYNSRNPIGWLLAINSLVSMVFGVISVIQFSFRAMSAFDCDSGACRWRSGALS